MKTITKIAVREKVNATMMDLFELSPDQLEGNPQLSELGLDSLDAADMVTKLEVEFGRRVDVEELVKLTHLNHLYAVAERVTHAV